MALPIDKNASGLHVDPKNKGVGFFGADPVSQPEGGAPTDLVATGAVKDSDTAASAGVAVKVALDNNGVTGFLNATNAGNADAPARISSAGPFVHVDDNDAPVGVALYFDEDATDPSARFLAVSPTGRDIFVPLSDGKMLRVKHSATAASEGVAVYFDDDAANAHERLLFVSPTDEDGAFATSDEFGSVKVGEAVRAALVGLGLISGE